jgi:hypothetical protein
MFTILPESAGDLVCLKAAGRLTDEDYQDLMPRLEAVIAEHGSLRLLADLTEFEGWQWRAAWDDLAFGIKHWNQVSKIAIVGDASWEHLAAKIAGKLMPAEVRSFPADQAGAALDWIRSD